MSSLTGEQGRPLHMHRAGTMQSELGSNRAVAPEGEGNRHYRRPGRGRPTHYRALSLTARRREILGGAWSIATASDFRRSEG
jgi:hypothetical protein